MEQSLIQILAWILAALFGAAAGVLRKNGEKLAEQLRALRGPANLPPAYMTNSVMVLGLGGSGKTTLVGCITHDGKADPRIATARYVIHSVSFDSPGDKPKMRCKIFMSDYAGQNLGSLVAAFLEQQKLPYSPMRHGYIRSLVLVVDLFPPPEHSGVRAHSQASIDAARVSEHIRAWNDQCLAAVYGMLTDTLNYVCIFINKADLLAATPDQVRETALSAFVPLRRIVERQSRGALVEVIVGSAENGSGLNQLKRSLFKASGLAGEMRCA